MARGPAYFSPNPSFKTYQPACKPGSVGHRRTCARRYVTAIPLGQCSHIASSNLPGRRALHRSRGFIAFAIVPRVPSLFDLAPGGVCHAVSVAGNAVRSYRTFSPLLAEAGGSFSVALSLGLPPPGVIRHRMSMEPGLSSPAAFRRLRERPSGRLTP